LKKFAQRRKEAWTVLSDSSATGPFWAALA
jgi:hypothetical protein